MLAVRVQRVAGTLALGCLTAAGAAHGQTVLVQPAIDPDYNRGRNISVNEQGTPDYDALGINVGSVVVHPALTVAAVATSNVFLDDGNKKQDVYASFLPFLSVDSNWAVHKLQIIATGDLRRYASQSLKNQNAWYLFGHGQIDIKSDANLQINTQIDHSVESPYFQDVLANLTVPSSYIHKFGALKATYVPGRSRFIGAMDFNDYRFNAIRFADGSTRSQRSRDRSAYRGSGVYEFALSPSISVYAEASYDVTRYVIALPKGVPNRDSTAPGLGVGTNFDLAGLARGSLGIGYSRRRYRALGIYPTAQGVSGQAKIEFFPSELYTIQVVAQRQLQDVSLTNTGAYWNNTLSVGLDHPILVNLIVSGSVQAIRREYIELRTANDVFQVQVSGRYQANRKLGFNTELSYGSSNPTGPSLGNPFHELRVTIGVRIRG